MFLTNRMGIRDRAVISCCLAKWRMKVLNRRGHSKGSGPDEAEATRGAELVEITKERRRKGTREEGENNTDEAKATEGVELVVRIDRRTANQRKVLSRWEA